MRNGGPDAVALGVDIGGTAVKSGVVDLSHGRVLERVAVATPRPAVIGNVIEAVAEGLERLVSQSGMLDVPLGVGVSGDVRDGEHTSGVNLDPSWIGAATRSLLQERLGRTVHILNDADAAGIAEVRCGALKGQRGVAVLLTFGTGIGSAVSFHGEILPNSNLGQFPFRGLPVENLLSAQARERRGIDWHAWAREVSEFLTLLEEMLRPELIVIGGGASGAWQEFHRDLRAPCPVVAARLGNDAGVVGAALAAADATPLGRNRAG